MSCTPSISKTKHLTHDTRIIGIVCGLVIANGSVEYIANGYPLSLLFHDQPCGLVLIITYF